MNVKGSLKGKVAFITGAGSGIGRATAKYLAFAGASVMGMSRDPGELNHTIQEIQSNAEDAAAFAGDVTEVDQMKAVIQEIDRRWGRLDIVFANAGINGVWAPIEDLSPEEWEKTIRINLTGTFLTVKYSTPLLKRQGGSVIINASVNGTRMFSNTEASAYASSKAGQVAFAKMIALEFARQKVRVNAICPGAIETKIDQSTQSLNLDKVRAPVEFPEGSVPLNHGEPGTAGQIAQLVWFLAS